MNSCVYIICLMLFLDSDFGNLLNSHVYLSISSGLQLIASLNISQDTDQTENGESWNKSVIFI